MAESLFPCFPAPSSSCPFFGHDYNTLILRVKFFDAGKAAANADES
ncbi:MULTISPECIES: hypothetical protein [Haematobacter]|nr:MULTISPECIES: hypothetical protein [Haematobacter]